jgi:hypothetical protein
MVFHELFDEFFRGTVYHVTERFHDFGNQG